MNIKITWCEKDKKGWIEIDGDRFIRDVSMTTYKKWSKLFAKYGTTEQHTEFLERIKTICKEDYLPILNNLLGQRSKWDECARGLTFEEYTREYGKKMVDNVQRSINGIKRKIESLDKRYAFLKGLLQ